MALMGDQLEGHNASEGNYCGNTKSGESLFIDVDSSVFATVVQIARRRHNGCHATCGGDQAN